MRYLVLPLIVLTITIFDSCTTRGGAIVPEKTADPPTVAVVKATRSNLSNDLLLTAEFEPFQEVDVMAKVSGYIKEIKVDIGDRVRDGQLLATLEIPEMQDDLARAAASIEQATAELATARDDLQRAQSLQDMSHLSYTRVLDVSKKEPGLVPQQDVDEAHSRDLVAEAQVSEAKSRIAECEQRIRVSKAEQARTKTLYQYGTITAPFTGVITKRYANSGSLIQAGTSSQAMPVARVSENGLLRLALPVPESAVPSIHPGETVDVQVSALHRTFPGRIARFADKVDEATRTMKTEVDVPNPSLILVPGMYAEVKLTVEERKNVLTVPVEAVDGSLNAARVFIVVPSGEIRIIPVTLGLEGPREIEVRSGNIKDGDAIVVGSRSGLKEGIKVLPKEIALQADSAPKP